MNRKLLFISILILLGSELTDVMAQTYAKKFGIEVNGGIREYGGDRGNRYFLARKPEYQALGVSLGYYLNPSFDATLYGSVGDLGHRDETFPNRLGFTARVTDVLVGVRYKFTNGYILPMDARIRPYLIAGYGGMQSVSKIYHDQAGYVNPDNRTWYAAHWNAGGGVRIGLTDFMDLSLQILYNYSYDDNYDGLPFDNGYARLNALHDAFLYHSAGLVFNFGANDGEYKFAKDKDKDGIPDKYDVCPNTPEGYAVDSTGCPLDNDNDGVINEEDRCPNAFGKAELQGCPDIGEELNNYLKGIARGIYFETGKSVIKPESYVVLNNVVEVLQVFPTANIAIEGHTDNVGNPSANMTLSQQRAEAVRQYLKGQGIDETRMTATGYGETKPQADNSTEEGRSLNRRVEIKLSSK